MVAFGQAADRALGSALQYKVQAPSIACLDSRTFSPSSSTSVLPGRLPRSESDSRNDGTFSFKLQVGSDET